MKARRASSLVLAVFVALATTAFATRWLDDQAAYAGPDLLAARQSRAQIAGPLRVNPSNGRYFIDASGKAVYLTGSHTWNNLSDQGFTDPPVPFDFDEYLRFLLDHRHNFIRLWRWELTQYTVSDTARTLYSGPHPWQRGGSQKALDGKARFDLTNFNEAYFDRLRARVQAAGKSGIYVSIMLFEGWGMRFIKDGWRGHPFNGENNVNGIDCDLNRDGKGLECFTLADPRVTRLQEAYVRKIVDTVNDLDNVLYQVSNENQWDSFDWEVHWVNYIHEYERARPKQHPVGLTSNGGGGQDDTARLFESRADWVSPNSLRDDYRQNPPVATGSHVVIADTDHLWGLGGDISWVWKSFLRGLNPIYMDLYREQLNVAQDVSQRQKFESVRRAMGHTAWFASRMDLGASVPRPELASTGYCLANPGGEYLVYLPFEANRLETAPVLWRFQQPIRNFRRQFAREVSVDLTQHPRTFAVEWFNPSTGEMSRGQSVAGGQRRSFDAPFSGDAVLYLRAER